MRLILLALLAGCGLWAEEVAEPAIPRCEPAKFSGEVAHGERFEKEFGPGLLFRLVPETLPKNPQGWVVEVRSQEHSNRDFLMVATPPYRSSNPRYIDTSYGRTALQAVEWSPRSFSFVLTDADFEMLDEVLEYVLWPGNHTREQVEAARKTWNEILKTRVAKGKLVIVDSRLGSNGPGDKAGRIEWLKFEVDLCIKKEAVAEGAIKP